MDMSPTTTSTTRHDGWTPARKAQFLDALAGEGNIRAACARVGLSREAAYRLRRRDALFARAWAAALVLARVSVGGVLGTRALEGVEEEVWLRGEVVGTTRRYDSRLLLAHMARLDRLAEDACACEDAGRFDELLACVAGKAIPAELAAEPGELPPDRDTCALVMAELASEEASDDECSAAYRRGRAEGAALWDAWFADACDTVDRLLGEAHAPEPAPAPWTLSSASTSALAGALLARDRAPGDAPADGRPAWSSAAGEGCQSGSANT